MSSLSFASALRSTTLLCRRRQVLLQLSSWPRSYETGPAKASPRGGKIVLDPKWQTPGVELPPPEEWWKIYRFPEKRKRKTISNPDTAKELAEKFVPEGSKGKVIVEAWAGPGQLTRALLALPRERISKIIVLEEEAKFFEWIKPLTEVDDRVHFIEYDAFHWNAYKEIENAGLFDDVDTVDWNSGVHPQLQFIAQVPSNVHGEQLIAQLARAIPDKKWLFRFGRVPLDIITSRSMYERLAATPTDFKIRCKVSVMAQGAAEMTKTYPCEDLLPTIDHFYHPTTRAAAVRMVSSVDAPVQPVRITPLEDQLIEPGLLDAWDFVTRNLFIIKATPLVKSITGLGPGAQALLKKLDDPSVPADQRVDVTKAPRELTVQEWKSVVTAFNDWPFRPQNLSIGHMFMEDARS